MLEVVTCFNKVKRDCMKFIKSQETVTEKFKAKEKMIKSYLIPVCFWIAKKTNNKTPYFVETSVNFLHKKLFFIKRMVLTIIHSNFF